MEEKKAQQITLLDLRLLGAAATDYFIICHGDNTRQVEAIGREIDERVKRQTGEDAWHIEGMQNGEWVLSLRCCCSTCFWMKNAPFWIGRVMGRRPNHSRMARLN
jgi:ribosome silencing factor RsfS/YbeB/iojap